MLESCFLIILFPFFLGTRKMSVALMLTPPPQKKRKRIDRIPNGKNLTIIQEINNIEQDRRRFGRNLTFRHGIHAKKADIIQMLF